MTYEKKNKIRRTILKKYAKWTYLFQKRSLLKALAQAPVRTEDDIETTTRSALSNEWVYDLSLVKHIS